jgi:TRAP-type uncharacterized transport system substrate-binding protein
MRNWLGRALKALQAPSRPVKAALLLAVLVTIAALMATFSRHPDLSHVEIAFLSASENGNYHAIVDKAAAEARRRNGRIENLPSAGSIENIERLAAAKASCDIQFALVQDGLPWPKSHPLQLIGRLPIPESFVVLGRDADRIRSVADLRGMRVGIGPEGSGSAYVARQVMAQLAELGIKVTNHTLSEQLAMLERGDLDLGAMVIAPGAQLMLQAVRDRKLQIADLPADALADRLPSARGGIIKAGYYDPVRELPPIDKRIIEIDTLVVGNGCARESVTQGVITALVRVFPNFVAVNRERPNLTGLEYAPAARSYFDNQGPDVVGEYVPWVIDIMPTARWVQLVFAFSLLFGAQAGWHRFRLWRLDARRVRIEAEVTRLFAPGTTVVEIAESLPEPQHRTAAARAQIDSAMNELAELAERCRRQSLSMLVPMGQEMNYRYQEGLIADLLHALRQFRARLDN